MILISTKYGYILLNQLQHVSQGLEAIWGVEVDPSHRSKNARQVCGGCCIAGNSCGLPMPSASSEFKAPNFWDFSMLTCKVDEGGKLMKPVFLDSKQRKDEVFVGFYDGAFPFSTKEWFPFISPGLLSKGFIYIWSS